MTRSTAVPSTALGIGRIRLVGVAVLIALAAVIALAPSWSARLSAAGFDAYQTLAPRRVQSMPVTVVAIDEKSLAAIGRWPWPRSLLARLIDQIARSRPAAVGVDIFMPETDPLSPERFLGRAGERLPERYAELLVLPSNDKVLARALAAVPSVLPVAGMHEPTRMPLRVAPFAVQPAIPPDGPAVPVEPSLVRFAGALTNIDELNRAVRGWGLISVDPTEGAIRRIPLAASIDGTLVPAFAVELLRVAVGVPALRLIVSGSRVQGVQIGNSFIPTESDGAVRVHFSPSNPARFVSAIDVLEGRVDPDRLERKLVLIGVTGVGQGEYHPTPLGVQMPGSEIHAQLVENIYDGTLLLRPDWARPLEIAVLVLLGALLVWATPTWKPYAAALLAVGGVAILIVAAYVAFRSQRLVLDAATPGVALLLLFGTLLLLTLAEATRQKMSLERLMQAQREQNARIAGELEAARRIQTATLPNPDLLRGDHRVDLAAAMVPAREVGGDLYDFFRLDERRLFLLVGDVAGKGLSASIFMAVSKALYKSATLRGSGTDIGMLMAEANAEVSRDNSEMLFVTAFAGVLDLDTGELDYCNAGHEHPYLVQASDAAVRSIGGGGGPPLCAVDAFAYGGARYRMRPGELLCVISDGVTEAQSPAGELYGRQRVREVLYGFRDARTAARTVVERLCADVDAFVAGSEPADDLTVLALRWKGAQAVGGLGSPAVA